MYMLFRLVSARGRRSTSAIRIATYGDSRADMLGGGSTGPNMNDGAVRDVRSSYTNQPHVACLPFHLIDSEVVANGGCSGEQTTSWNSGARLSGRTFAAVMAIPSDVVVIQYGTNDVQNNVGSAATRDSIAASVTTNLQALITALLAEGRRVVFETTMQRTEPGYQNSNTVFKRDCVDIINSNMITWVQAHASYGSALALSDIRALTNVGGATSGAFLNSANGWTTDGIHLTFIGALEVARATAAVIRAMYSARPQQKLIGADTPNLITGVSAANVFATGLTAATAGAIVYGTDGLGRPYFERTMTVTGSQARATFEVAADVGSSGRTPPNTVTTGDKIKGRCIITVDDGAGGVPTVVGNVFTAMYASYIGGTPGLQTVKNGSSTASPLTAMTGDFDEASHQQNAVTLTAGSSLIGAPAAGSGLRMQIIVYGTTEATSGTFKVRVTNPEIRKLT